MTQSVKVLVTYQHRPMCVGLFLHRGFLQLGCDVRTAGPSTPEVYGHTGWEEFREPDFVLPNEPIDIGSVVSCYEEIYGCVPDLIAEIDQFDYITLTGTAPAGVKWAHLAVENFNQLQYERSLKRKADAEHWMIQHDDNGQTMPPPLPIDTQGRPAEWAVFGADVDIHPLLSPIGQPRPVWVCQIGSPYEPRPTNWNELRWRFDQASAVGSYTHQLAESAHTIFGKVFSYAGMAEAYNRSLTAISCSNVDFIPMRAAEAFAMGCVLLSDDVPAMRDAFGAPYRSCPSKVADLTLVASEPNPEGIWIAHDRTSQGIGDAVEYVRNMNPEDRDALLRRAYDTMLAKFQYRHICQRMLQRVGLA